MEITKVNFTDAEKTQILNLVVDAAINESGCHERRGHEFEFDNLLGSTIQLTAKVLIDDDFSEQKPSRYASNDIYLLNEEGNPVECNLDANFEDRINRALINEFHKTF